jgi:hypothetical protein
MERIARSFRLVSQSYRLLMQDKELMVLPFISGIVSAAVAISFFFGFGIDAGRLAARQPEVLVPVFLMYVAIYAVGLFFQAAVVAGATERMRGGDPTIGSSLAAASRRAGAILLWAIVAATVGTVLRALRGRAGFIGRIVAGLAGAAWSLATFFIVPILVLEDLPVTASFKQSVDVFKRTWGESFIGGVGLGIIAFACWATLIAAVGILAWMRLAIVALAVGFAGAIVLAVFFSALQGIYVASLYQYATGGQVAGGFDRDLLNSAFVPKTR